MNRWKRCVMLGAMVAACAGAAVAAETQPGTGAVAKTQTSGVFPTEPTAAEGIKPDAVVAADGSGKYTSVRAAIDAAPQITNDDGKRWTILVKPGTYKELIYVQREKRFIRLVGADARTTEITYDLVAGMAGPDGKPIGTFRTPTVNIDADDFEVSNLTIANGAGRKGQALALTVTGDRVAFRHCRFTGWQDTIFLDRGRQYFEDCVIEGATDFIFGGATAWFEKCQIVAVGGGYLTAASTPDFQPFGFVFNHCQVSGLPGVKTYLGRPWRDYAKTIFLNTEMSDVVKPEGWHDWGKAKAREVATYAEYASTGPGGKAEGRVTWAKPLKQAEAATYTVGKVLDGWQP